MREKEGQYVKVIKEIDTTHLKLQGVEMKYERMKKENTIMKEEYKGNNKRLALAIQKITT